MVSAPVSRFSCWSYLAMRDGVVITPSLVIILWCVIYSYLPPGNFLLTATFVGEADPALFGDVPFQAAVHLLPRITFLHQIPLRFLPSA
ncbi:hypothetical protein BV22DRAFT_1038782 [Leucogyrophana mollusca]|uniref:Uncharacterized protein n=1 Tax=Leucogyrophana mollusca TaxID=85980 RepID=A0ACB8B6A9_9AGAM|nr:hypothetical protein BV22DRAFT_1038782 [Leucogyrophana mollusca]